MLFCHTTPLSGDVRRKKKDCLGKSINIFTRAALSILWAKVDMKESLLGACSMGHNRAVSNWEVRVGRYKC